MDTLIREIHIRQYIGAPTPSKTTFAYYPGSVAFACLSSIEGMRHGVELVKLAPKAREAQEL